MHYVCKRFFICIGCRMCPRRRFYTFVSFKLSYSIAYQSMNDTLLFPSILVSHVIGDYIIQNDKMAKMKKESHLYCFVHCLLYTWCFFFFTELPFLLLLCIFIQHFLQDRWNFVKWSMVKMGKKIFSEPPMAPWSIIVMDNIYHLLFIYFICYLWYSF